MVPDSDIVMSTPPRAAKLLKAPIATPVQSWWGQVYGPGVEGCGHSGFPPSPEISPLCTVMDGESDCEDLFGADSRLNSWVDYLKRFDCSIVPVTFPQFLQGTWRSVRYLRVIAGFAVGDARAQVPGLSKNIIVFLVNLKGCMSCQLFNSAQCMFIPPSWFECHSFMPCDEFFNLSIWPGARARAGATWDAFGKPGEFPVVQKPYSVGCC